MRTTIRLPQVLVDEMKMLAEANARSFNREVEYALNCYLGHAVSPQFPKRDPIKEGVEHVRKEAKKYLDGRDFKSEYLNDPFPELPPPIDLPPIKLAPIPHDTRECRLYACPTCKALGVVNYNRGLP